MKIYLTLFFAILCPALLVWLYPSDLTAVCTGFIIYKSMIFGLGVFIFRETVMNYRPERIKERLFKNSRQTGLIKTTISRFLYSFAILLSVLYCISSLFDLVILYTPK